MSSPDEAGLTLRDKLDWSWLVLNNLRTITDITKSEKYDAAIVSDLIDVLEAYVPEKFREIDLQYTKAIAAATTLEKVDLRPKFGSVRLSEERCAELGITPYEYKSTINPIKKLQVIIGLLNRFGVVAKKDYVERIGHPEDPLDESDTVQETNA